MKALILVNDANVYNSNNEFLPAPFLPLNNSTTVIERQIRILNINGLSKDDIFILVKNNDTWNSTDIKEKLSKINANIIFESENKDRNAYGFMIPDELASGDDVLVIDSELVFENVILRRLNRCHYDNVAIIRDSIKPSGASHRIVLNGDRISKIEDCKSGMYPWKVYIGIARLSGDVIKAMKDIATQAPNTTFIDAIRALLDDYEVMSIDYDDLLYGKMNGRHSDELIGGSYSKINYRLVVKKEDDGEGRDKLINEIKWLLELPEDLKPYFSEVLSYDIENEKIFFTVPYYGSKNLRDYALVGLYDASAATEFIENLLDWMFENVYCRKISDTPSNWILDKHINRVYKRLDESSRKSDTLSKLVSAEKLIINGTEYKNIRELYTNIEKRDDIINILQPESLVMIHGDLHFQNILLLNDTDNGFLLVDPRGELLGSDVYYDIGKLWHSFHAKYDFIHTDQFRLQLNWNDNGVPNAEFKITNALAESVYDEIYKKVSKMITKFKFINDDPNWEMKALFSEASHLCSVMPFHINKAETEARAVVLYLTGVILINEFCQKYLD